MTLVLFIFQTFSRSLFRRNPFCFSLLKKNRGLFDVSKQTYRKFYLGSFPLSLETKREVFISSLDGRGIRLRFFPPPVKSKGVLFRFQPFKIEEVYRSVVSENLS